MYIDDEVKQKAISKLKDWFREYDNDIVDEIDKKFDKKFYSSLRDYRIGI